MLIAPLASARDVRRAVAELIRPPRRLRPSEAAEQYLRNDRGEWSPALAPMMVEPLDALGGREYQGIIFAGPARTGKTMGLILGGVTYVVTCEPGDMLITQMSQDTARDFSRTDLDRAIRHSPELHARLSPRARDDNTFDKFWRSGIVLKLGWPAVSQLSSKTLRYVFLTDYDRPTNRDNVDGEGPLWDLAFKRIETYMSRGKCLAESSPGEEYRDPNWRASTPHEAPPARGIASLYNRGTRGRWYWPCLHCNEFFQAEPGLGNFAVPKWEDLEKLVQTEDLMALAEQLAHVVCPKCGASHELQDRPQMNGAGVWVHEGQTIDGKGRVIGDRRRTNTASFWLGGPAAPYQRWDSMLLKYLQGVQTYVRTGDEAPLRTTTNTDQGALYLPRAVANRRTPEDLMQRLEEWPRGVVPEGVKFLTASVDVQGNRFVVSVYGWGVALESWLVNRFEITSSNRKEGARYAALKPSAYVEDWDVLIDQVVERAYPLAGHPDLSLKPALTVCDSGGQEGVTSRAYDFWRSLKKGGSGIHRRFQLVKGDGRLNGPRVQRTFPDARGRKARAANARGDVPVWLLNTNVLKDAITGDLARPVSGAGCVHLPQWVDPNWLKAQPKFEGADFLAAFFGELMAETRTDKGWEKAPGARNEAFDLHCYARAACIILKAENINWQRPPAWANPVAAAAPAGPLPADEKPPPPKATRKGYLSRRRGYLRN